MQSKSTSLGHLRGERKVIVKRQIPFRYTDELDKDLEILYRLQYTLRNKNKAITQAIKISAAFIKSIDPKKDMDPDKIKDILKEKLKLEGKDLQ